jgi:hypothetical protein
MSGWSTLPQSWIPLPERTDPTRPANIAGMTKRSTTWVYWARRRGTSTWRGTTEPPTRLDPRLYEITITAGAPPSADLALPFSPEAQLILLRQWFDEVVEIIGFFKNDSFLENHVISIRYSSL